jgi:1-acyl-sn-glycerol-3-phosphate acyltransferase
MRRFYKFWKEFSRYHFKILYGYELIHFERLAEAKSMILAANHISWFDPPIIGALAPFEIGFLAKAELFKNRIFGALISNLNSVPIVRKSTDLKAINKVLELLGSGKSLLIFPEGTRNGKSIKPGVGMFAMRMKCDILPIYIENTDKLMSCLFSSKKVRVTFGERIRYEEFADWEMKKENYQKLAEYTYGKITELKG